MPAAKEPEKVAILKKLHAILSDIDYIQKDATNQHHGYNYASEKAIKQALHGAFKEHRVILIPATTDQRIENGITLTHHTFTFYDVDTGDSISTEFCGQGADKQDKGVWKAITGAIKYVLTGTFLIPTGDDPEKDEPSRDNRSNQTRQSNNAHDASGDTRLITEKQQKRMFAISKEGEWDTGNVKELLGSYGYGASEEVTRKDYEEICNILEAGQAAYLAIQEDFDNATQNDEFAGVESDPIPFPKGDAPDVGDYRPGF
jgi:hypothetical protein